MRGKERDHQRLSLSLSLSLFSVSADTTQATVTTFWIWVKDTTVTKTTMKMFMISTSICNIPHALRGKKYKALWSAPHVAPSNPEKGARCVTWCCSLRINITSFFVRRGILTLQCNRHFSSICASCCCVLFKALLLNSLL